MSFRSIDPPLALAVASILLAGVSLLVPRTSHAVCPSGDVEDTSCSYIAEPAPERSDAGNDTGQPGDTGQPSDAGQTAEPGRGCHLIADSSPAFPWSALVLGATLGLGHLVRRRD